MRNLKKVLSLALALVMLLGMMVVGAGAATKFEDDKDVKNQEAVSVVSAIKVLLGDEKNNFNPTGYLTRAEAAVVIAKLDLGEAFGNLATTNASTFSDVPASYWGKPYIDYCFARGLIAGVGDNKYNPNGKVSGVEFALMVSRVLGYVDKAEGIASNADWQIKAAALARKAGLTKDVELGSDPMTRDEMAQVAFNALQADLVEYPNGTGSDITVNGAAVTIGAGKAEPKKHSTSTDIKGGYTYDGHYITDKYNWKLCEEKFPGLQVKSKADEFERPTNVWTYDRKDICTVKAGAEAKYTAAVKGSTIASDMNVTAATTWADIYVDGKPLIGGDYLRLSAFDDQAKKFTGNGVLTEVWYEGHNDSTDYDYVRITMVNTYVGRVSSVSSKNGTANVSPFTAPEGKSALLDKTFKTTAFAVDDLVSYQAAWNDEDGYDVISMNALTEPAEGTLTKWKGTSLDSSGTKSDAASNFTVDGKDYEYSAKVHIEAGGIWNYPLKSTLAVYVDEYGYALYVDVVEAAKKYATVIGVGGDNPYGSTSKGCTLLLEDGTIVEAKYTLASGSLTGGQLVSNFKGDVVSYTVDDDGVYTLTPSAVKWTPDDNNQKNDVFVNGKSELKLNGTNYYTTAKTVFMVCTGDMSAQPLSYTVYTGYANMPSFDEVGIKGFSLMTNKKYTTQVDVVYIAAEKLLGTVGADTYFVKNPTSTTVSDPDGNYYVLNAVVNGEETEVNVAVTAFNGKNPYGLFAATSVVKNSKGIITSFKDSTNASTFNVEAGATITNTNSSVRGVVRDPEQRAVLGIGNNGDIDDAIYWAYTDNTKVMVVTRDTKGYCTNISLSDVKSIDNDTNDMIYASLDSNKTLKAVIIVKVSDDEANKPDEPAGTNNGSVTYAASVNATKQAAFGKIVDDSVKTNIKGKTVATFTLQQPAWAHMQASGNISAIEYDVLIDGKLVGEGQMNLTADDTDTSVVDVTETQDATNDKAGTFKVVADLTATTKGDLGLTEAKGHEVSLEITNVTWKYAKVEHWEVNADGDEVRKLGMVSGSGTDAYLTTDAAGGTLKFEINGDDSSAGTFTLSGASLKAAETANYNFTSDAHSTNEKYVAAGNQVVKVLIKPTTAVKANYSITAQGADANANLTLGTGTGQIPITSEGGTLAADSTEKSAKITVTRVPGATVTEGQTAAYKIGYGVHKDSLVTGVKISYTLTKDGKTTNGVAEILHFKGGDEVTVDVGKVNSDVDLTVTGITMIVEKDRFEVDGDKVTVASDKKSVTIGFKGGANGKADHLSADIAYTGSGNVIIVKYDGSNAWDSTKTSAKVNADGTVTISSTDSNVLETNATIEIDAPICDSNGKQVKACVITLTLSGSTWTAQVDNT